MGFGIIKVGEGVISFGYVFVYVGCLNIVMILWLIKDDLVFDFV